MREQPGVSFHGQRAITGIMANIGFSYYAFLSPAIPMGDPWTIEVIGRRNAEGGSSFEQIYATWFYRLHPVDYWMDVGASRTRAWWIPGVRLAGQND